MRMFRFLGLWIGVAVRTDSPIGLPLANAMWDLLLGRRPSFEPPPSSASAPASAPASASASPIDQCLAYLQKSSRFLSEIDTIAANELQRISTMPDEFLEAEPQDTQFVSATGNPFH